MQLRCLKCGWHADEPDSSVIDSGTCPDCQGQLWSGSPTSSAILPEAVAMVFESGSRVARQSAPHYRQCDLTTGIETQSESQPFPAELLASPPVVTRDGASTDVFNLPTLPDLNFETPAQPEVAEPSDSQQAEDPCDDEPDSVAEETTEEQTLMRAPSIVDSGSDTVPEPQRQRESAQVVGDPGAETPAILPALPTMLRPEPVRQSRGVGAGLSNAPLFIDMRQPRLAPLVVSTLLSLVLVIAAVFFPTELAEPWLGPSPQLNLTATQRGLDLYARALDDFERGHLELAHEKVTQALAESPVLGQGHTLLAVILAKKGEKSLALQSYLKGQELQGSNRDLRVEALLERAVELTRIQRDLKAGEPVDWPVVGQALELSQGALAPPSPSSAKP